MNSSKVLGLFITIIVGLAFIPLVANMAVQAGSETTAVQSINWVDIIAEIMADGEDVFNGYLTSNATYPLSHDAVEADSFSSSLRVRQAYEEGDWRIRRGAVWFDTEEANASFTYARIRLTLEEWEANVSDTVAQHDVTHGAPEVPPALTDYEYSQYLTPYDARATPTLVVNATVYLNLNAVGQDYIKACINGSFLNGEDSYWAKWIVRCYNDYADIAPFTEDETIYLSTDYVEDEGLPESFAPTLQLGYDTITYEPTLDTASLAMIALVPLFFVVMIIAVATKAIVEEFRMG